jgi:hypothetical protein
MVKKSEWSEIDAPFFSTYTHTAAHWSESDDRSGEERMRVESVYVCGECVCLLEWRVECGMVGDKRQAGDKSVGCMSDGCPISTDGENKGSTRGLGLSHSRCIHSSMDVYRTPDGALLMGL